MCYQKSRSRTERKKKLTDMTQPRRLILMTWQVTSVIQIVTTARREEPYSKSLELKREEELVQSRQLQSSTKSSILTCLRSSLTAWRTKGKLLLEMLISAAHVPPCSATSARSLKTVRHRSGTVSSAT